MKEQKNDTGLIFKNDKRTSENHPHGTGKAKINGVEYWVSSWTKQGAKGPFQSLAFTPMDKSVSRPAAPQSAAIAPPSSNADDSNPFV